MRLPRISWKLMLDRERERREGERWGGEREERERGEREERESGEKDCWTI